MKVLVFAPHNDDEILGVGGTMARLAQENNEVYVCEYTSGKMKDILQAEAKKAHTLLGVKKTFFLELPVCRLRNMEQAEINSAVMEVVKEVKPDIAFIPHKGDMHIDHAEVVQSAMVALRPVSCPSVKKIYVYETLSETEWNVPDAENAFVPNAWFDITDYLETKVEAMKCYESQIQTFPNPRSEKAIRALAEYRGATMCLNAAESFVLIRSIE